MTCYRRSAITVLGAGLTGVATALELAKRGAQVTLLDQDPFAVNRASLRNEGKIHLGLIYAIAAAPDGSVAIPFSFDWGGSFWEDLAYVKSGGLYGFIDKTGAYVAELQYTDAGDFSDGLAAVEKDNDLWGYIDYSGNTILPFQYELAWPFANGIAAVVFQDFTYGYIDKAGNVIWKSDSKSGMAMFSGGPDRTAEARLQASLMQK